MPIKKSIFDEYLKSHPNMTLAELNEMLQNKSVADEKRKNEVKDNFENFFKEQDGKWFLINFNDYSYMIAQYNDADRTDNSYYMKRTDLCISFSGFNDPKNQVGFSTSSGSSTINLIKKEVGRMKWRWLISLNPYFEEYDELVGYAGPRNSVTWIKPISTEYAQYVLDWYDKVVEPFVNNIMDNNYFKDENN